LRCGAAPRGTAPYRTALRRTALHVDTFTLDTLPCTLDYMAGRAALHVTATYRIRCECVNEPLLKPSSSGSISSSSSDTGAFCAARRGRQSCQSLV